MYTYFLGMHRKKMFPLGFRPYAGKGITMSRRRNECQVETLSVVSKLKPRVRRPLFIFRNAAESMLFIFRETINVWKQSTLNRRIYQVRLLESHASLSSNGWYVLYSPFNISTRERTLLLVLKSDNIFLQTNRYSVVYVHYSNLKLPTRQI